MNEISRICAQCSKPGPLDARYCPHCGYDTTSGAPALRQYELPVVFGKAALPVLAGAASLMVRAVWKLMKSQAARRAAQRTVQAITQPAPVQPAVVQPAPRRTRRTIHIRSSWAVGDANGVWRKGSSEQTIEIDD
jgi:predicted amidophosphoribosyltransferase